MESGAVTVNIPWQNLFLLAFGGGYRPYIVPAGKREDSTNSGSQYRAVADIKPASKTVNGLLGHPVFSTLTFLNVPDKGVNFQLLEPLVEVSLRKNIVKTVVAGLDYSIKELISCEDYAISIKSLLVDGDRYSKPTVDTKKIHDICLLKRNIEVVGDVFDVFGITNIVVEQVKFTEVAGFVNLQAFEMTCISDRAVELIMN